MGYNYYAYPWGRWIKWGILALIVLILVMSAVSSYNGLVAADQDVQSKWGQVENLMQRRADLINNEVEIVKGYVKHEEKVFGDIADARSVLNSGSSDIQSKIAADDRIATAAKSMLVLVENYPNLKASEQFTNLQTQVEGAENRVSVARRDFINSVQSYNTKVTKFPGNIFARLMGFQAKEYFKASPDAQQAPKINF